MLHNFVTPENLSFFKVIIEGILLVITGAHMTEVKLPAPHRSKLKVVSSTVVTTALILTGLVAAGAPAEAAVGDTTVKVASYNVDSAWREVSQPNLPRWDARVIGIKNNINTAKPDVIGIQEAPNIKIGARLYTQASDIQRMTGYTMYQPTDGATMPIPIMWRGGLYDKTASGYKVFENRPYPNYGRAMTWVKLKSKSTGKEFFVFNTHFMVGADKQSVRDAEGVMLAAEIKRVNPKSLPMFVTGDFNSSASSSAPQTKNLATIGVKDSYGLTNARMHPEYKTYNGYELPQVGSSRIDQVYVGGTNLKVSYWENWTPYGNQLVGGRPPTDHDMIYAKASF